MACEPATFPVAIDVGHDRARPGAISARGVPEFEFNLVLARAVLAELLAGGFTRSFLIVADGAPVDLRTRAADAARAGASVLVSIHHDSVQPRYLQPWTFDGRALDFTSHARGFSLFVSAENRLFAASRELASRIGSELGATGKRPSLHHAEPIEGEGRQLLDPANGVYRFDRLLLLRSATMPAVLLEAGVIKNREEELVVATEGFQADVAGAIRRAIEQTCGATVPQEQTRPFETRPRPAAGR